MKSGIEEMKADIVRTVGQLCAAAAVTAPKSGGQLFLRGKPLFIETVFIDDKPTLKRLAEWMRARGKERRQDIWFRDAAMTERIDGVLLIGLKDWYPPIYDCGACGYATCAEFMSATKKLREDSGHLDNRMLTVDFDAAELAHLPGTGTIPVKRPDKRWSHAPHVEAEE